MSREALVLLVCCCDFRDRAERLIPSKSLRNAVIWAFPGLLCILRMCAPRRAAAVVRPRGREKSADRRRRILISRLLIIRASVPRRKSPFPAYFKGFPAVSPLIPPYPAFLKYPVSPHLLPVIFLPIAVHMGFREQALVAIVILCGAPSTVSGYVMAKNMGGDHVLSSSIIVLTTVLSAVTLTLTLFILRSFALI